MRTPRQAGWFMLAWLACQIAVPYLLLPFNLPYGPWLASSQLAGAAMPVAGTYLLTRGKTAGVFAGLAPPRPRAALYAVLLGLALQPLGMLVSMLSSVFDTAWVETLDSIAVQAPVWESVLLLCLLPAVTEELVCRGVALSCFRGVRPWKAALVNGLIFGVMHLNLRQFFYAFVIGAAVAWIVILGGSVVYGIITHFTINLTQTLMNCTGFILTADMFYATLFISLLLCPALYRGLKAAGRGGSRAETDTAAFSLTLVIFIILGGIIMAGEFL